MKCTAGISSMHWRKSQVAAFLLAFLAPVLSANAQEESETLRREAIEVIGTTPVPGAELPRTKIPYRIQSASDRDLEQSLSTDLTDYATRKIGGLVINEAQSNRLQPDILYRGFTASPLLGLPQGLAVYQNSVRVNEAFGDTVNWELLPEAAIARIDLIGGANPLFGLNTLGGALAVQTKNGFTHPGYGLEARAGSFGSSLWQFHGGGTRDRLGAFVAGSFFDEDGWRDESPSDARSLFSTVGYRSRDTQLDFNYTYGDSDLTGNGAAPPGLLRDAGRRTIFTAPDNTKNDMPLTNLEFGQWFNPQTRLAGNVFYRSNDTNSFNGDGSEFEQCAEMDDPNTPVNESEVLCEEGQPGYIEDQEGNPIAEENDDGTERNAINNRSRRDQKTYGGALELTLAQPWGRFENQLILGGAYFEGATDFDSSVEIASLNAARSTEGTGLYVPEEGVAVETETRTWSGYFTDTFSLSEQWSFTLSGRYNHTWVELNDRGGSARYPLTNGTPRLTGEHEYGRFNPAAGVSYAFRPNTHTYFNYSESSRAPTPVELACADEGDPCNLPNSFLADPPLEQVITRGIEWGMRSERQWLARAERKGGAEVRNELRSFYWDLGLFYSRNEDDILFQCTGGATCSEGFFANIGETQRVGAEFSAGGQRGYWHWGLNYTYLYATYGEDFTVSSPGHPNVDEDEGDLLRVEDGDRIPGIPLHSIKGLLEFATPTRIKDSDTPPTMRVGAEWSYNSSRYLRGDEANEDDPLGGYFLLNLYSEYRPLPWVGVFLRIDNVLDKEYETFGLYGEDVEVEEVLGVNYGSRFVSPGAPRAGYLGIRISM